jgi:hypothetical protein
MIGRMTQYVGLLLNLPLILRVFIHTFHSCGFNRKVSLSPAAQMMGKDSIMW